MTFKQLLLNETTKLDAQSKRIEYFKLCAKERLESIEFGLKDAEVACYFDKSTAFPELRIPELHWAIRIERQENFATTFESNASRDDAFEILGRRHERLTGWLTKDQVYEFVAKTLAHLRETK